MSSADREEVCDPYIPRHGNAGYAVQHYDLELDYRVASNRLAGRAQLTLRTDRRADASEPRPGTAAGDQGRRGRPPGAAVHHARRQAARLLRRPAARRFAARRHPYNGSPKPLDGLCGDVGWEELSDGVIVAGQPDGAPSWFPCNDLPVGQGELSHRGHDRVAVHAWSPTAGSLSGASVRAGRTWVYEQPEPMATYLATVQIGRYDQSAPDRAGSAAHRRCRARLRRRRARLRPAARDDCRSSRTCSGPTRSRATRSW